MNIGKTVGSRKRSDISTYRSNFFFSFSFVFFKNYFLLLLTLGTKYVIFDIIYKSSMK